MHKTQKGNLNSAIVKEKEKYNLTSTGAMFLCLCQIIRVEESSQYIWKKTDSGKRIKTRRDWVFFSSASFFLLTWAR